MRSLGIPVDKDIKSTLWPASLCVIYFMPTFLGGWLAPHHAVCRILVLQPGFKPVPTTLEAQSFNHWTAREVPWPTFFTSSRSASHLGDLLWEALKLKKVGEEIV